MALDGLADEQMDIWMEHPSRCLSLHLSVHPVPSPLCTVCISERNLDILVEMIIIMECNVGNYDGSNNGLLQLASHYLNPFY